MEIPSALKQEVISVGKKSIVYVLGAALSRAVGFFMIPVYTRFIVPGNYGAMELIVILSSIVAMIISMGVTDSMSRYYYAEKDPQKRNEVVSTIVIAFGVLAIPIVIIFMSLAGMLSFVVMDEPKYRFCLQIAIAAAWFGMLCEISFAYLRMLYMAKTFVLVTTAQLILALSLNIWFVVFLRLDILGIFYSTLITEGFRKRVFEVNNNKEIVWEYAPKTPDEFKNMSAYYFYRAYRIPPEWVTYNIEEYECWEKR